MYNIPSQGSRDTHRKLGTGRLLHEWFRYLARQRLPLCVRPTHDPYKQGFFFVYLCPTALQSAAFVTRCQGLLHPERTQSL